MEYDQAKQKALRIQKSCNACKDYGDAWFFYDAKASGEDDDGVIIMKNSGKDMTFAEYLQEGDGPHKAKRVTF